MVEAHGIGREEDVEQTESGGCLPGADPRAVSERARERGAGQLGTVGSGNHFIELQEVEDLRRSGRGGVRTARDLRLARPRLTRESCEAPVPRSAGGDRVPHRPAGRSESARATLGVREPTEGVLTCLSTLSRGGRGVSFPPRLCDGRLPDSRALEPRAARARQEEPLDRLGDERSETDSRSNAALGGGSRESFTRRAQKVERPCLEGERHRPAATRGAHVMPGSRSKLPSGALAYENSPRPRTSSLRRTTGAVSGFAKCGRGQTFPAGGRPFISFPGLTGVAAGLAEP